MCVSRKLRPKKTTEEEFDDDAGGDDDDHHDAKQDLSYSNSGANILWK